MLRSLFILMLVVVMAAVGYYYEREAGSMASGNLDALGGTAISSADAASAAPRSGVDLAALDSATRPQDDFYQFANGGWLDRTGIPDIYSGYTVYHEVNERAEIALRRIVELAAANPGEAGTESQQVGDIYRSWMDETAIDARGIEPIRDLLLDIETTDSAAALGPLMARLYRQGIEVPYDFYVYPDLKQSTRYAVYFGQTGITMPNRDYYIDLDNENFAAAREALPGYIAAMLARAGMDPAAVQAAAQGVYDLEAALARAHWDSVTIRDPEKAYNPYAAGDLDQLGRNLGWSATRKTLGLYGERQLIIRQPSYFESLDTLLAEVPLQTWKNYLAFRVLDGAAEHLDAQTAGLRFDYRNRVLKGQPEERPRWKRGIEMVNTMAGEAVGKLYVAEYFPPEAKAKMEELVGNVIATLDQSLGDLEWMSPETRGKAREKLSKFTAKIGYPDQWKDYSELQIVAGDHAGNMRRAYAFEYQRNLDKLGGPVGRNEWMMTPQTVNAYYSPAQNEIVFPAARLQPPFFQLDADDAINYGAVGGVIGHEISHGFDDKGSKFDGDGNLVDWWTAEDRAAFDTRTRALVEQFNGFEPVEGMHINGELTLGENIGDLSGWRWPIAPISAASAAPSRRSSMDSPGRSAFSSATRCRARASTAKRKRSAAWPPTRTRLCNTG
jgi:predicted metalloendopeptidase